MVATYLPFCTSVTAIVDRVYTRTRRYEGRFQLGFPFLFFPCLSSLSLPPFLSLSPSPPSPSSPSNTHRPPPPLHPSIQAQHPPTQDTTARPHPPHSPTHLHPKAPTSPHSPTHLHPDHPEPNTPKFHNARIPDPGSRHVEEISSMVPMRWLRRRGLRREGRGGEGSGRGCWRVVGLGCGAWCGEVRCGAVRCGEVR